MKSFRSLISFLVMFLLLAVAAFITVDDKKWHTVSDKEKVFFVTMFHFTGYLCLLAVIISHSATDARKWTRMVSRLTQLVCVASLGLFHLSMDFLTPEKCKIECTLLKMILFGSSMWFIIFMWDRLFMLPKVTLKK